MMYSLPSEQKERISESIKEFNRTGSLVIDEPCNCGSHIRHNNGGNYHQVVTLKRDNTPQPHNRRSGKVFVKYDNTCELTPPAEWEEIYRIEAEAVIKQYADWL